MGIGLYNWRKLTNHKHQIRLGSLVDGIAAAEEHQVDCLLGTEMGTSASTRNVQLCNYVGDWELGKGDVYGDAVGCFFRRVWEFSWVPLTGSISLKNARFWLLVAGDVKVLLGVLYMPHGGWGGESSRVYSSSGPFEPFGLSWRADIQGRGEFCVGMRTYQSYFARMVFWILMEGRSVCLPQLCCTTCGLPI